MLERYLPTVYDIVSILTKYIWKFENELVEQYSHDTQNEL